MTFYVKYQMSNMIPWNLRVSHLKLALSIKFKYVIKCILELFMLDVEMPLKLLDIGDN